MLFPSSLLLLSLFFCSYSMSYKVTPYVTRYELHAIQLAKLKSMAMENEERSNTSAYEVEMAETKQAASSSPSTP